MVKERSLFSGHEIYKLSLSTDAIAIPYGPCLAGATPVNVLIMQQRGHWRQGCIVKARRFFHGKASRHSCHDLRGAQPLS